MRRISIPRWLERIEMPRAVLRFWMVSALLTLASFLYTMTMTHVFHLGYPYGSPQFFREDRWFDFMVYHDRFQHFRTASFWDAYEYPFTYPAPLAVLYGVLYRVPHALRYYLPATLALYVAGGWIFARALGRRGVPQGVALVFAASVLAMNYPLRTLFESANTEGIVALLAAAGVYAVLRDRCWLGAALIAFAGSMKIFPLVLLALLLSKRRYREFAWGFAVAAAVTLASLAIVGPSIAEAQRHIDEGIHYVTYQFIFSINLAAVTFNHSLFTLLKFATMLLDRHVDLAAARTPAEFAARAAQVRPVLQIVFNVYVVLAALFGTGLYFGWMRRLPLLNQVLALTICALILPPLSADYTLLHLLFPFALLCVYAADRWRSGVDVPGLDRCLLCFPFIFCFQTYITWGYRFSCEARTIAMVTLLVFVMRYRFPWRVFDGLPRDPRQQRRA